MNKNQKYTLTLNLEADDDLNRAVDELIRARVLDVIRSQCDHIITEYVKTEFPKVIGKRLSQFSELDIKRQVQFAARDILTSDKGRKILKDGVREALSRNDSWPISHMMSGACQDYVNRKLDGVVDAKVIKAVVDAVTPKD